MAVRLRRMELSTAERRFLKSHAVLTGVLPESYGLTYLCKPSIYETSAAVPLFFCCFQGENAYE